MGLFGPSKAELSALEDWSFWSDGGTGGRHVSKRGGPAYKSGTSYKGKRRGGDADAAKGRGKSGKARGKK